MATRRTAPSTPDMLGRDIRPGDVVAVAVSTAYQARAAAQRLVRVENIYLDDTKGQPYGSSFINFRDPGTQHLYPTAPDDDPASRPITDWTGLPVNGAVWVPTVVTDPNQLGHGYNGPYEVVYLPEVRIVGATIDRPGTPPATYARRSRNTYETSAMIRLDDLSW